MADHLLIFARHPELGQVKTRLAYTVGPHEALRVYRDLLARTHAAANGVAATKTLWLAGNPLATDTTFSSWTGYTQRPQPAGDLGERMHQAFVAAFAAGATTAIIIGTDCPELGSAHLQAAFQYLTTHDVVVGPALDGGYYLLGMRAPIAEFFRDKAWSTASVLADTLADARRLGLSVAQLPALRDVDTADDLQAWQARRLPATS
ncbi:TIGR04282 family arsenosugar biosynthesis glycosyltransferase [Hymenobacter metallicola]|uniref:Glycosyltransferase n=1 Tax=Hymenobacter metallicola TaxID=2563114 RepID=A0A4Z0QC61_9BACT|nr:TIGR04282 family arsenosugar biosynthesis glycosyltransferase [Hymenobacter metallicola]TGE27688.1 glycosyltransferase [Hymenobacter metallicola]